MPPRALTSFVASRVPLLPIETLTKAFANSDSFEDAHSLLSAQALAAIAVASPELATAITRPTSNSRKRERVARKLFAYLNRMASRATPFGAFASVGMVPVGDKTTLRFDEELRISRSRPDMGWLIAAFRPAIASSWDAASGLRVILSDCTLEQGGRLFIFPTESKDEESGMTASVSLSVTPIIDLVRQYASEWITMGALSEAIARDGDLTADDARSLVLTLWNARVFIDELAASPTSEHPVIEIVAGIARVLPSAAASLWKYVADLKRIDELFHAGTLLADDVLAATMSANAEPPTAVLQLDAFHSTRGSLGQGVKAALECYAGAMMRMGVAQDADVLVDRFRADFEGDGRLVPFFEFVDAAMDLGSANWEKRRSTGDAVSAQLARLLAECIRTGRTEAVFTREQFDELYPPRNPDAIECPSFEIGFQIAARDVAAIDAGDFVLWPGLFQNADRAASSLARFADGLALSLDEIRAADDRSGYLSVELVFNPLAPRLYNVMIRPDIERAEVQFGVHSESATVHRISPADLYVGVDRANRLFLWSQSLRSRIRVVESHMFATNRLGPLGARLLAAISSAGVLVPGVFSWGALESSPFLPRIRIGNVVVSKARWHFTPADNAEDVDAAFGAFIQTWNVPRYVTACGATDNACLIDTESVLGRRFMRDEFGAVVTFEETLQPDDHWLQGRSGRYAAELVCSFANSPTAESAHTELSAPTLRVERLSAGEPWLYAELVCSSHRVDSLLRCYVAPLVRALTVEEPWFFVRYRTAATHVRLRVRTSRRERLRETFDVWQRNGTIRTWIERSYEPEVERYGGFEGVHVSECIFVASSKIALDAIVERRLQDRTGQYREAASFIVTLTKLVVAEPTASAWIEYSRPGAAYRKLNDQQRAALSDIRASISQADPLEKELTASCAALRKLYASDRPGAGLFDVVASLAHMHCNRLGLNRDGESLANAVAWHAAYGHAARASSGSRSAEEGSRREGKIGWVQDLA